MFNRNKRHWFHISFTAAKGTETARATVNQGRPSKTLRLRDIEEAKRFAFEGIEEYMDDAVCTSIAYLGRMTRSEFEDQP